MTPAPPAPPSETNDRRRAPGELAAMLTQPAVSLGERQLDIADLVLLGLLTGDWVRFERGLGRRLDLEAEHGGLVSAEELRAAATAFRYAHRLVSAAEFTAWLRDRSLALSDLSGVLHRQLLEQRCVADPTRRSAQAELAPVLRAEAICGGVLQTLADAATRRLAAADRLAAIGGADASDEQVRATLADALTRTASGLPALGEAELRERLRRLRGLERSLVTLRDQCADQAAIAQTLSDHRLDWMRLSGQQLTVEREGAAREARMLICEDGLPLAAAARRAGATTGARSLYLEEAPTRQSGDFAAAAPGEVVGPWEQEGSWHLLLVTDKRAPAANDRVLRERAVEEILADVLARHAAGRTQQRCVL